MGPILGQIIARAAALRTLVLHRKAAEIVRLVTELSISELATPACGLVGLLYLALLLGALLVK